MLHINDLTYRIEGRMIFEQASSAVPTGHKVGLIGRNGAGKTTLLKLLSGDLTPDAGTITVPRNSRIGHVAQEAPGGPISLIDCVVNSDTERASLLAEAERTTDPHRIAEIQLRLTDIHAHAAPARAAQILAGLGFDEAAQSRPCSEFSGGWRMRVALASVLFLRPELLLLDEPTNYLDLEGTLWLENYLKTYPHTVIIVSHDRDLLNRSVDGVLHLNEGRLTYYSGGYDDFEHTRREQQRLKLKLKKKQDEERRRIQAFVDRFKAKATKAKQAQSRVKALAKMKPIAASIEDGVPPFFLANPHKPLASPLLRLEEASVGYTPGNPVLQGLNLRIDADDRIALLGQNGNGKSTFAKLLVGKLSPMSGSSTAVPKLIVGYFAQHQLDELNPEATPFDYMVARMPEATTSERRTRIGSYGFSADKADTKCKNLSGGEKARLLLALAAFDAPHLLILDEPTNHLDVDSRQALIQALASYEGAVILISHDRHLIEASADRLWVVKEGTVTSYDGDIDTYRAELLGERSKPGKKGNVADGADVTAVPAAGARSDQRRAAAERRIQLAPLKQALNQAEKKLEMINRDIAKLDTFLAQPDIYAIDPEKAQKAARQRGQLAKLLSEAEDLWITAAADYETASERTDE